MSISEKKKANRKGILIGAYVPPQLKASVERRAKAEFKTVSQVLKEILLREFGYLPKKTK